MKTVLHILTLLWLLAVSAHGQDYYLATSSPTTNAASGQYGLNTNSVYCGYSKTNFVEFKSDGTTPLWLQMVYQAGNATTETWQMEFNPADYGVSTNPAEPVIVDLTDPVTNAVQSNAVPVLPAQPVQVPITNAVYFSWEQPSNYDGDFMLVEGKGPYGDYEHIYAVAGTNAVVTAEMMSVGVRWWNIINAQGTEVTGESQLQAPAATPIGIMVNQEAVVTSGAQVTNAIIYTSLDLGRSWQLAGTNEVAFPPVEPSRFFLGNDLKIGLSNNATILETNQ